jgi:hypothetical protein
MRSTLITTATAAILAAAAAAGAQVESHTLYEWPAGADFVPNPFIIDSDSGIGAGGVEITDFTLDGEVVDTRIELTLHNVPPDFNGFPLDAAQVYLRITLNGSEPGSPLTFQKSVTADGFTPAPDGVFSASLGFSGIGGPMTAAAALAGLNGDVDANFWRIDWGTRELPGEPANYGPVSGRVIVDFIPADPPCICERTGDDPLSIDVFDLLAYLDQWFAQDAAADLDDNPAVDVFDLLTFLDCWFAGC